MPKSKRRAAPPTKRDAAQPELGKALEKNKQVAEDIKEAADDLLVVHEVLEKGLSDDGATAEVEQAVAHTGQIEKKLAESAETLDEVNESLGRAVGGGKGG